MNADILTSDPLDDFEDWWEHGIAKRDLAEWMCPICRTVENGDLSTFTYHVASDHVTFLLIIKGMWTVAKRDHIIGTESRDIEAVSGEAAKTTENDIAMDKEMKEYAKRELEAKRVLAASQ